MRPSAWSRGGRCQSSRPLERGCISASAVCAHLHTYSYKTLELPGKDQLPPPQFSSLSLGLPRYFFSHVLLLSFFPQVNVDKDRSLLLDWDRVRVFDREIAQMFLNMTKLEKEAQVGLLHPRSVTVAWVGVGLGSLLLEE